MVRIPSGQGTSWARHPHLVWTHLGPPKIPCGIQGQFLGFGGTPGILLPHRNGAFLVLVGRFFGVQGEEGGSPGGGGRLSGVKNQSITLEKKHSVTPGARGGGVTKTEKQVWSESPQVGGRWGSVACGRGGGSA